MSSPTTTTTIDWCASQDVFGLVMCFYAVKSIDALKLRRVSRRWKEGVEASDAAWMNIVKSCWFQKGAPRKRVLGAGVVTEGALDRAALEDGWYRVFTDYAKRTRALGTTKSSVPRAIRRCGHHPPGRRIEGDITTTNATTTCVPPTTTLNDFTFSYECPLLFENLTLVDERHSYCSTCKKCVTVVTTIEELNEVAKRGGCVSLDKLEGGAGENDDYDDGVDDPYITNVHGDVGFTRSSIHFYDTNSTAVSVMEYVTGLTCSRLTRQFPELFREDSPRAMCHDDGDRDSSSSSENTLSESDEDTSAIIRRKHRNSKLNNLWVPQLMRSGYRFLVVDYDDGGSSAGDATDYSVSKSQYWLRSLYSNAHTTISGLQSTSVLGVNLSLPSSHDDEVRTTTTTTTTTTSSVPTPSVPTPSSHDDNHQRRSESLQVWRDKSALLHSISITGDFSNPDPVHLPDGMFKESIYATTALMELVELFRKVLVMIKYEAGGNNNNNNNNGPLTFAVDGSPVPSTPPMSTEEGQQHESTVPWHILRALRLGDNADAMLSDYIEHITGGGSSIRCIPIVSDEATKTLLLRRPYNNITYIDTSGDDKSLIDVLTEPDDNFRKWADADILGNDPTKLAAFVTPVDSEEDDDDTTVVLRSSETTWRRPHIRNRIPKSLQPANRDAMSLLTHFQRQHASMNNIVNVEGLSETQGRPVEWILPRSITALIKEATEICNTAAKELAVYYTTQIAPNRIPDPDTDVVDPQFIIHQRAVDAQGELFKMASDCINALRVRIGHLRQPLFLSATLSFMGGREGGDGSTPSSSSYLGAASAAMASGPPAPRHVAGAVPATYMEGYEEFEAHLKQLLVRRRKMGKIARRR